jgi:uncharacterized protein (DUF58 family)
VARIDLALSRRAGGLLPGEHRSLGVGTGTELAQLRPYEPGDDLRQLDPSASARTNVPHVRQHVPERTLTTWIVLDVSASMAFGTGRRLKSDVAEGVATVLGQVGVRRGGRVAVVTCGGPSPRMLPPRGGRAAAVAVQRLAQEGVAPDGARAPEGLADALGRVRRVARQRGLIVVVSDFRDRTDWPRVLGSLAHRHALVAVEVRDPREDALPDAGLIVLTDPETGRQVEADTASARLREAFALAEADRRGDVALGIRRAQATHVILDTGSDWLRELARRLR